MKYLIILCMFFSSFSFASVFNHKPTQKHVEMDLKSGDKMVIANRTDLALDGLVKLSIWKMKKEGHKAEADKIESEWENRFKGTLTRYAEKLKAGKRDLGDYAPLSEWLSELYKIMVLMFGETACKAMHLDDINIANFAIPVVFAMHDILGAQVKIDSPEYKKHFVPFAGVVTYWSVFISCEVVTYGSGWFVVCTPAGMAGEFAMTKWVAPKISDSAWKMFWVE